MRTRAGGLIAALAILAASARVAGTGDVDRSAPPDEERFVNIALPHVLLTTTRGDRVDLATLAAERPVLLALVFTRCAGVCSPFLMSWRAADRWAARRENVQRVVLSFDPRDSPADMAALARHLAADHDEHWTFAVASPEDVRQVADAAGFWYDWDESRQQYDHPAMLAAARGGRIVRLLVGGMVSSGRLDELMREASGEFVPSYPLPGRVQFRCVQYDPRTGRLSLDWGFVLLMVPVGVVSLATTIVFAAGGRARRESARS